MALCVPLVLKRIDGRTRGRQWFSIIQRCVTLSSTESERVTPTDCVKAVVNLRQVPECLRSYPKTMDPKVFEDNHGAVQLARKLTSSSRTNHINVRYHFSRAIYRDGKVRIEHVYSSK